MHRTSIDPPARPSRFEESLQTPGGTVQRDFRLAATLDSGRKISLSGLEIGLGEVLGWHQMWRHPAYEAQALG